MNPGYFGTVLDSATSLRELPATWGVVTAHAPHGRRRPFAEDEAADESLRRRLQADGIRHWRVTGRSASGDHAEPGWAVAAHLDEVKSLGRDFGQDAIFWVQHDELRVSGCAAAAMLLRVGALASRWNPPAAAAFPGADGLTAHFDEAPHRLAAVLRFLGAPESRAAHFDAFVAGADESAFTLGDRLDAAAEFQNRLECAGRTSPFEKKNGYLHCCADALLATPPTLRPSFIDAFDEMWVKYGYDG